MHTCSYAWARALGTLVLFHCNSKKESAKDPWQKLPGRIQVLCLLLKLLKRIIETDAFTAMASDSKYNMEMGIVNHEEDDSPPKRPHGRPPSKGKNAPGKEPCKKGVAVPVASPHLPAMRSRSVSATDTGVVVDAGETTERSTRRRNTTTTRNITDIVGTSKGTSDLHAAGDNSLDAGQFGLLLSAISSSKREVNHQLLLFCKEIHKSSSDVTEKLARKFKAMKSIEFKRKGNEK